MVKIWCSPQLWLKVSSYTSIDDDLQRQSRRAFRSGTARRRVCLVHHLILCYRGRESCLDRTLPVGERHWGGHVLPRPRSTTPAISSKLSRRFLARRTHLAFVRVLFLAVWSSTCRKLDQRQQTLQFLVNRPCHFVTFLHHDFRGDLRH